MKYYYSTIKSNEMLTPATMNESRKHHTKRKKPNTKDYILHDSIHIKYAEHANL